MESKGLSGNALKIIAMLTMLTDHTGLILLGDFLPFRIIGRLAFPLYAYLLAEGCLYTKNRRRHFLEVFILGLVCQTAYFIAEGDLYLNVLLTFSLSIPLVYLTLDAKEGRRSPLIAFAAVICAVALCEGLTYFKVFLEYGRAGVLLPVLISLGNDKREQIALFLVGLVALSAVTVGMPCQWFCLFAVIPALFYNGKRGRLKLKRFFYLFYPAHLLLLYGLSLFL